MTLKRAKGRILALFAVMVAFLTCATATPALAANTPATGTTTTFDKYLVMDKNANVPNATFTFEISAGSAQPAGGSNSFPIYAGNDSVKVTGTPTLIWNTSESASVNVAFTPGDETYSEAQSDDDVTLGSNQKYAKQTLTASFTGVSYSAPGIYCYVIRETANAQQGIANDSDMTRTLYVSVTYKEGSNDELEVSSYALHDSENDKSTGFTNMYTTNDLTLAKTVTGNQGDRNKYFAFTVNITGAVAGTVYTVDLPDSENYDENPTTLTATEGSVEETYYLKHGQSIVIQGLTSETKYTITEDDYSTDGYKTINSDDKTGELTTGLKTMPAADHTVTFTNNKDGVIPTGILLETTPYLVMGAVVVVGLVALVATRRRRAR